MEANSQVSTHLNIEKQRYHPHFKHRFSSVQNQKLNIRYFSKGFFPNGNFPRVFSQAQLPNCAISQAELPRSVLAAALGPQSVVAAALSP